jgi:AcrR family transcriptional regulator
MPDAAARTRVPGRPRDAAIDEIVLRAAFELFLERGAEGATIDDVAKRTGVARATIYRRWKSRDLLLAALRALKQPPAGDPDAIAQMPSKISFVTYKRFWLRPCCAPKSRL